MFLDLYKYYRPQVGSLKIKNIKKMFEEIAKELRYKTKQNITTSHCENRWKHLERMYKKYIDNNNKTGRGRKDFEYSEIMDEILGKKRNINPVILLSSDTVINAQSGMQQDNTGLGDSNRENITQDIVKPNDTEKTKELTPVKRKPVQSTYKNKRLRADVLKEIKQDRKDFYRKLLEIEEKKLQEKRTKNKILEERNALIKQYIHKQVPMLHEDNIL